MLHRPIHAAALFLNLVFSYKCKFDFDGEVLEGLIACLNRMVPDVETRSSITHEMELYQEASGLFGYANAVRARNSLTPSKWLQIRIYLYFENLNFKFLNFNCVLWFIILFEIWII